MKMLLLLCMLVLFAGMTNAATNITLNLSPNPVNLSFNVSFYGHVNDTTGANATNNTVLIYINNSMYYLNNNTRVLENTTAWWNTSFAYRTRINITSTVSTTLNNTIVLVNLSTSNLINQSKMNSSCGDTRFTDANGNELQYTIENSTCNTTNTIYWAWTNLTGNTNTTIYAYYGNPTATIKTDYTNPDRGLVLYLHLDNNSAYGENSTLAYDFSKSDNNGTINGSTLNTTGRFARGYNFDGINDYIYTPVTSDFNITENLTLEAWFYAKSHAGAASYIVARWSNTYAYSSYVMGLEDTGIIICYIHNSSDAPSVSTEVSLNEWHHAVCTYNYATSNLSLYLDGVITSATTSGRINTTGSTRVSIGARDDQVTPFNGTIDEVRIYNRTLSTNEVLAHYNSTRPNYIQNHSLPRTDNYGNYNYTYTAPNTTGTYQIKANTTYNGTSAEKTANLTVQQGPLTSCQQLSSPNTVYQLNQSVTSNSGACFNITANNVTLDGMGFSVRYAITGAGQAVYALGKNNLTVKNLKINQTVTSRVNSPAIYLKSCSNNSIYNNTLDISGSSSNSYDHGIQLQNSTNTTISQNNITMRSSCDYCDGIFINASSHQNTISSNTITSENDYSEHGIEIRDSNQATVYNNTIQMNNNYNQAYCIYLYNSSNSIINQSTIRTDAGYEAVYIDYYSDSNLVANCNITAPMNGGVGVRINQYSEDNNITNTNITSHGYSVQSGQYSHRLTIDNARLTDDFISTLSTDGSINNVTIRNSFIQFYRDSGGSSQGALQYVGDWWTVANTFINCSGPDAQGIYTSSGNDLNLTNVTILTNGTPNGEALYLYSGSGINQVIIRDSIINASNDDDIYLYNSGTGPVNLTNTNFTNGNVSWVGTATNPVNVFWYVDANVTNTTGSALSGANVSAWDTSSVRAFTQLTEASGLITRQEVLSYTQNDTGITYYSNYTVNASLSGYTTNSTKVNLTTNKQINFILTQTASDSCSCPGAATNWNINMSHNCNITTDCNITTGYLNFTGTGYVHFNATINFTSMQRPATGQIIYIDKNGILQVH